MIAYLLGIATGLVASAVTSWIVWPIYVARHRLPDETWVAACDRELARLDRLAELEEIPDTVRSFEDRSSID